MKMKREGYVMIILAIALAVLVLSGCGRGDNSPITDINVFTGTSGLEQRFLKNAPPPTVYENSEFEVGVFLNNEGIHSIENGIAVLTLEEDYLEPADNQNSINFQLKGKDPYDPLGEQTFHSFKVRAKKLEPLSQVHTSNLIVTACYDYQTWATPTVCVDPDIYNVNPEKKSCRMEDITMSSQGSPVAVTKVEVRMMPEGDRIKPWFRIFVENKGNGEVVDINKVDAVCGSGGLDHRDWNTIYATAYLGKDELTCKPNPLRLKNKEDYVLCYLEGGIDKTSTAYSTLLGIYLDYGYTSSISKEVKIEKEVII